MTQKDYIVIAQIFADIKGKWPNDPTAELVISGIQAAMAQTLRADNPRFDYDRFNIACERGRTS